MSDARETTRGDPRPEERVLCSYPILLGMKREKWTVLMAAHDAYVEMRAHRDRPDQERFERAIFTLGSALMVFES